MLSHVHEYDHRCPQTTSEFYVVDVSGALGAFRPPLKRSMYKTALRRLDLNTVLKS